MFNPKQGKPLVSDGAIGTELIKRSSEKIPEILNVKNPKIVEQLHLDYINSGSDIITTNSFGIIYAKLNGNLPDEITIYDLAKLSAQIANKVKTKGEIIFGSIGATGLKPNQNEFKKLPDYLCEQVSGLRDGNVDIILIETMTTLQEMRTAFEIARREANLPIALTMAFQITKNGIKTFSGVDFKIAVEEMLNLGAEIIGANCGNGFDEMVEIAKQFKSITKETPLIIQPSAGIPQKAGNELLYPDTPEKIKQNVKKLIELNVNIIGGCCGTTPEHIKVIREIVDENFK